MEPDSNTLTQHNLIIVLFYCLVFYKWGGVLAHFHYISVFYHELSTAKETGTGYLISLQTTTFITNTRKYKNVHCNASKTVLTQLLFVKDTVNKRCWFISLGLVVVCYVLSIKLHITIWCFFELCTLSLNEATIDNLHYFCFYSIRKHYSVQGFPFFLSLITNPAK